MMNISQLTQEQIPEIMQLIKVAIATMEQQGIPQWDEIYPSLKEITADVQHQTQYGLMVENILAGIMTLDEHQPEQYQAIPWNLNDPRPLVVHRFCISPQFQGRGFSKIMMRFVEVYAGKNNYQSIRLDSFTQNPISCSLYRKLGFIERGIVTFRKGDFFCFEKEVIKQK